MPNDVKGVKMIYPSSRDNPQSYYYNGNFDSRVSMMRDIDSPVHKSFNTFAFDVGNNNGQIDFYTSSKYNPAKIKPVDHSRYAVQGYMQDTKDWLNLECTAYLNFHSVLDNKGKFVWRVRTGLDRQKSGDCESCGYQAALYVNGTTRFSKRFYSGATAFKPFRTSTDDIEERWIGFKFAIYNNVKANSVALEIWLDTNDSNDWVPIHTLTDTGFGKDGIHCNGVANELIEFGGPIVSTFFVADNTPQSVDIRNLSIREIDVNGSFSGQEGL